MAKLSCDDKSQKKFTRKVHAKYPLTNEMC